MYNQMQQRPPAKTWKPAKVLRGDAHRPDFLSERWGMDASVAFEEKEVHAPTRDFEVTSFQALEHPLPRHVMQALSVLEQAQRRKDAQVSGSQPDPEEEPFELDPPLVDEAPKEEFPFIPQSYKAVIVPGLFGYEVEEAHPSVNEPSQPAEASLQTDEFLDDPLATPPAQALTQDPEPEVSQDYGMEDAQTQAAAQDLAEDQGVDIAQDFAAPTSDVEVETEVELNESAAEDAAETPDDRESDTAAETMDLASSDNEHPDEVAQTPSDDLTDQALLESDIDDPQTPLVQDMTEDINEVQEALAQAQEIAPIIQGIPLEEVQAREKESFERGRQEGREQAKQELQQSVDDQCKILAATIEQLNGLVQDSQKLYEPLKRLSLHLAEQLVLGELALSPHVIDRLVERCLQEIPSASRSAATVFLNAQDKAQIQNAMVSLQGLEISVAPDLLVGSVRVQANDLIVEDLIQSRLAALVRSMNLQAPLFEKKSALLNDTTLIEETEEPHGDS